MPKELFASSAPGVASPRRRWTLAASIVAHAALLFAIVAASFASFTNGPQIVRGFADFVMASAPPVPPVPAPPDPPPSKAAPVLNPDFAPPSAPDGIRPEIESPPPPGIGVPGAISPMGVGVPGGIGLTEVIPSPPPPAKLVEIPRVGGNIRAPTRLVYVPPTYPSIAQTARVEGSVRLEATLDETGAVRDLRVLTSIPLLDRAAIDAVRQWRYSPTLLNGIAVPVIMTITVTFTLR